MIVCQIFGLANAAIKEACKVNVASQRGMFIALLGNVMQHAKQACIAWLWRSLFSKCDKRGNHTGTFVALGCENVA
jgi:hypothetical protein